MVLHGSGATSRGDDKSKWYRAPPVSREESEEALPSRGEAAGRPHGSEQVAEHSRCAARVLGTQQLQPANRGEAEEAPGRRRAR